jgi:HEAT repeat protein
MDEHALSPHELALRDRCDHESTWKGASAFVRGQALRIIRDQRLYRATHPTFEGYVTEHLGLGRKHARKLMDHSSAAGHEARMMLRFRLAATTTLLTLLPGPDAPFAILELGLRRAPTAVEPLTTLMLDPATPWQTAWFIPVALAAIGDSAAVEPLISTLANPLLAGPATEALEQLRDPRALLPLIALFDQHPVPSLATVLGRWGDRRAVPSLIRAMDHPDSHMRFYTARALGRLGDRRALPRLHQAVVEDTRVLTDTKTVRGNSVSRVAAQAIERIHHQDHEP